VAIGAKNKNVNVVHEITISAMRTDKSITDNKRN